MRPRPHPSFLPWLELPHRPAVLGFAAVTIGAPTDAMLRIREW